MIITVVFIMKIHHIFSNVTRKIRFFRKNLLYFLQKQECRKMENQIYNILNDMAEFLNVMQMKKLQKVLIYHLNEAKQVQEEISNEKYLEMFLTAKQIEGCSDRTIQYYRVTIEHMLKRITIPLRQIATEDIRQYLIDYQKINNCGKVTIDNIRRNLSSFFSWLEEEDHILKSPVKRIHKIKTKTVVKEVISDESIEILRDNCKEKRDLAIIDLLFSTGMRVGDDDDKIRLNQRKPSKYKGLRRFGPEKNLQRINKFMKERPIFYKNLIQMKENIRFYLRCFYCITKVMILQFNSENRTELARNG